MNVEKWLYIVEDGKEEKLLLLSRESRAKAAARAARPEKPESELASAKP